MDLPADLFSGFFLPIVSFALKSHGSLGPKSSWAGDNCQGYLLKRQLYVCLSLALKSKTRDLNDRGFSVFSATPLDMDFCAAIMQ
jgi:hypothetical protein